MSRRKHQLWEQAIQNIEARRSYGHELQAWVNEKFVLMDRIREAQTGALRAHRRARLERHLENKPVRPAGNTGLPRVLS